MSICPSSRSNRRGGHAALRVLSAGGETHPTFLALQAKEAALAADVARLGISELARHPLLSVNAKTTVSLDFPIGQTCAPTQTCASVCYAASPRAASTWRKSLRKRLRNLLYFRSVSAADAAERLTHEFKRTRRRWNRRGVKLDYLRVNGGGDLTPEIVLAVNCFAALNPDVRVWIVTRRFDLASDIADLPNVYLQLSLDGSTPRNLLGVARSLVRRHPRAYLSFLRTRSGEDTLAAAIVFNEKRTLDLEYNASTGCPADAGRLPLENVRGVGGTACSRCRKCFSDSVLDRQATLLDERGRSAR